MKIPYKSLREFRCRSEPQEELFKILIKIFPDAEMEYKIGGRINKKGYHVRWADIGVPSLKIDFEYDGWRHKENPFSDEIRDEELKMQGWKTFRINKEVFNLIRINSCHFNLSDPVFFIEFVKQMIDLNNKGITI